MIQSIVFSLVSILLLSSKIAIVSALELEEITGAHEAPAGSFKYQVALDSKAGLCGGGIIGDRHVITAAHCVVRDNGQFISEKITVVAGTKNLNSIAGSVRVPVKRAFISSAFIHIRLGDDVAVLELSEPLGIGRNPNLSQLSLPSPSVSYAGRRALVAGFGLHSIDVKLDQAVNRYVEYNGKYDGKLRYAETIVQSQSSCKYKYMKDKRIIYPTMVCSKIDSSKATRRNAGVCSGDSGSPLVYNGVVIGTVSSSYAGCTEDVFPGIYTRISSVLPFVRKAMHGVVDSSIRVHNFV